MKKIFVLLTVLSISIVLAVSAAGLIKPGLVHCGLGVHVDVSKGVSKTENGSKIMYSCKIDRGCGGEHGLVKIKYLPTGNGRDCNFTGREWELEQLESNLPPGTQTITIEADAWDQNNHHRVDDDSLTL